MDIIFKIFSSLILNCKHSQIYYFSKFIVNSNTYKWVLFPEGSRWTELHFSVKHFPFCYFNKWKSSIVIFYLFHIILYFFILNYIIKKNVLRCENCHSNWRHQGNSITIQPKIQWELQLVFIRWTKLVFSIIIRFEFLELLNKIFLHLDNKRGIDIKNENQETIIAKISEFLGILSYPASYDDKWQ